MIPSEDLCIALWQGCHKVNSPWAGPSRLMASAALDSSASCLCEEKSPLLWSPDCPGIECHQFLLGNIHMFPFINLTMWGVGFIDCPSLGKCQHHPARVGGKCRVTTAKLTLCCFPTWRAGCHPPGDRAELGYRPVPEKSH